MKFFKPLIVFLCLSTLLSCQTPTRVKEVDLSGEERIFEQAQGGKELDYKRVVIADVRTSFDHALAKLPRSFHAQASDWDLEKYKGEALHSKAKELRRLLSLKGVDPLTRVAVLGYGLKGQGEEFVLLSTLKRLGIKKVHLLSPKEMQKALTTRENLPPLENVPYWSAELGRALKCQKKTAVDVSIGSKKVGSGYHYKAANLFQENLQIRKSLSLPKGLRMNVTSPGAYWAYGLVMTMRNQARQSCLIQ